MQSTRNLNPYYTMFLRIIAAVGKLWAPRSDLLQSISSPGETRKLLDRERARADRMGSCLSVITFAPLDKASERITFEWLIYILKNRLRSTDEIGWVDDGHLCAMLPGTAAEGAAKVVEDVCQALPEQVVAPVCTVYVYPDAHSSGEQRRPVLVDSQRTDQRREEQPAALEVLLARPMPAWKRCFDVVGVIIGLILLAPLLAAIAMAVKLSSPGAVLFCQRRAGRGGRPFLLYKFRTMVTDAEAQKGQLQEMNEQDGPAFKIKNDPRVTRLGRFLRATSLDELPQLWNILKGEMSLVGPRPLPCDESDACDGWHRHRLDVTPGLTCIWQVRGRCRVSFADWMRMDVRYVRSRSLPQDLKLLLLTVPAVLLRRGAQ